MTLSETQQPGKAPTGRPPRGGRAAASRTAPLRRCIATGRSLPQAELLRFVVAPDGELVFDLTGKLPGRGLWVSAQRAALEKACKRNLFAKAARSQVRLPQALPDLVEGGLRRRCLDMLGLARRAGLVAAGFEKAKARLAAGEAALLLQAADGADDGRDKLAALGRAVRPDLAVFRLFAAVELGRVLGRDRGVHLALKAGTMTERLTAELRRYRSVAAADGIQQDVVGRDVVKQDVVRQDVVSQDGASGPRR